MFNQLTPADVVTAIGATVRTAARSEDRTDSFSRDQLMSAYSATRHLAVELSSYEPVFAEFCRAVIDCLRGAAASGEGVPDALSAAATEIESDPTTAIVGATLAELLVRLRKDGSPAALAVGSDLHDLLRGLADREVDLLASALA